MKHLVERPVDDVVEARVLFVVIVVEVLVEDEMAAKRALETKPELNCFFFNINHKGVIFSFQSLYTSTYTYAPPSPKEKFDGLHWSCQPVSKYIVK